MKFFSLIASLSLPFLCAYSIQAFEPPSPNPIRVSYRVLDGEIEGLSRMRFHLTIVEQTVTGYAVQEKTRFSAPVTGTLRAGVFDLNQHSTLLWDEFDKLLFNFRGEAEGLYGRKPLEWNGECRSLAEGTDFAGKFQFREIYPAGVAQIDLYQLEKHWSQVRNGMSIERAKGGTFPQIRNPRPGEEEVNNLIRKEWYRLLHEKEPETTPSISELEASFDFEPLDPDDDRGFSNINQTIHLITATVVFNGRDHISIHWKNHYFVGAEGWPETDFYRTYNLVSGKQLELSDFLKPGFEKVLPSEIEKAFYDAHFPPDSPEKFPEGFGKETMKDSRSFFLTSDGGIGFDCNFMEHSSMVGGIPIVYVEKDRIAQFLKPNIH